MNLETAVRRKRPRTEAYVPNLFPFRVAPDYTVNNRRLSCFRMCVFFAHSIDLDVFRIVYVDETFIDV